MVFYKRKIIMANKDDHKSCVLTKICIAYNLILTCRSYVKFDVNVTRQILLIHVANNRYVQFYPFIPRHFKVFMKKPKTSVSVNFEFSVDMGWQNFM